ncbi:hypothetical protein ACIQVR_41550 [Streptomyces xanthochromogenes]|uniref:lipase/acyltransferase domain-containing protein n=1 Tax=Streptomyces xanthochromogenes TaxID=67384 RepID=UPI003821A192
MSARHLVVVIPGIGGSVLERTRPDGRTARAWDASPKGIAGLPWRPGRLSLEEEPHLRPVGLITSKRLLPGWTVVHGYEGLVQGVAAGFPDARIDVGHPERPDPRADVLLFPYDFRRGIAEAADRLAARIHLRLAGLSAAERRGRVVVVAHSMGGLVARYWLGVLQGWRECRALITLGTPHRGAPKALDWLVNGVRIGGVPLPRTSRVIRGWPSVAELLPRYPMILDTSEPAGPPRDAPGAAARDGGGRRILYPHQLPLDWLRPHATRAFDLHRRIEAAWAEIPRSGTETRPRFSWSHPTLTAGHWDGTRLRVTHEQPDWLAPAGWEDDLGDGTVPAASAVPIEDGDRDTSGMRTRERHGPLAAADWVGPLIGGYLRREGLARLRGGEERPISLGLELAEAYLPGAPVPVRATVLGNGRAASREPVDPLWAVARPDGDPHADPVAVALEWDARTRDYRGELPAAEPGLHTVTVTARDVPGGGDLAVTETLAVLDGDET